MSCLILIFPDVPVHKIHGNLGHAEAQDRAKDQARLLHLRPIQERLPTGFRKLAE